MKIGVNLKIDVTKIDKALLFAGKKGTYLDMTVFIDIDNVGQYGDNGMIVQDVKQGEQRGNILGNATIFWNDTTVGAPQQQAPQQQQRAPQQNNRQQSPNQNIPQSNQYQNQQQQQQPAPDFDDFSDDIPF